MKKILLLITMIMLIGLSACTSVISATVSDQDIASGKMVEAEVTSTQILYFIGSSELDLGDALAKQCDSGEVKNVNSITTALNYIIVPVVNYSLKAKGQCK